MLGRTGFQLHSLVMQYTNQSHLKAETTVSDLLDSSPLLAVLKCLEDKVKYGRLHKAFLWWFTEKQKKSITFSYGFTRLESVLLLAFCLFDIGTSEDQLSFKGVSCETSHWHLLLSNSDAVSIYSTVEVHIEQVEKLKTSCQHFFNANCLLLNDVTSTVRTIGHEG